MKSFTVSLIAFLAVTVCAASARAQPTTCVTVGGRIFEQVMPPIAAPGDPFGRVVGIVTGRLLGGAKTAILTSRPDRMPISTVDTFATDGGLLIATGSTTFLPMPTILPNGPTLIYDDLIMTIVSGTGEFKGATGNLRARGFGIDLAPGQGKFDLEYSGQVCTPNK